MKTYPSPKWTATVYGDAIKLRHAAHTCHVTFQRRDEPPTKHHQSLMEGLDTAYTPDEDDDPYMRVCDVPIESFNDLATLALIVQRPLSKDEPNNRPGRIIGLKGSVTSGGVEARLSLGSETWEGVGVPPDPLSAQVTVAVGRDAGAAEVLLRVRRSIDEALGAVGGDGGGA